MASSAGGLAPLMTIHSMSAIPEEGGLRVGIHLVLILRQQYAHRADQSRTLDPFDCREPRRCAVVVVSRLNPIRFDGGDIPSIAGVERRSQLFLTDGVRASIGTIVTEAQHIQGPIVLGYRR